MDKKQLKRIFNKNIFKDKSFIKVVCLTIVLLLVLVLGNNFGYVSAEENSSSGSLDDVKWLNWETYQNSDCYNASNQYVSYMDLDSQRLIDNALVGQQLLDFDWTSISNMTDSSDYSYYLIVGSAYPSNWTIYVWQGFSNSNSFIYYNGASDRLTIVAGDDASHGQTAKVKYTYAYPYGTGANGDMTTVTYSDSWITGSWNYMSEIGTHFVTLSMSSAVPLVCMTNVPLYDVQGSPLTGSVGGDMIAMWNGQNNNLVNVNYLLDDAAPINGFNNMVGIGDGLVVDDEIDYSGIHDNMYVDYADWTLNNYIGDVPKNFRNMSVSFTSNLNDYINEYLDNDTDGYDEYTLWLDYNVYIDFYYQTVVDYGNAGVNLSAQFANVTLGADYNHDLVFTNDYHWSCTYDFEPSGDDANYINSGTLISLKKFKDEKNCVFTMPFSGLFAYLTPNGSFTSDGESHDITMTLYSLMDLINNKGIKWSPEYEGLNQFKITCTAKIMYDDGTELGSTGNYIETFNLLDGTSTVNADSMMTNYYPSNNNTDTSVNVPSNSTGTSVSTASNGNITQTVTVSNEGAKYIPSIISSLIPSSFGDSTTGLASRFTTLVDSNNFITVMANTVPAVPTTVWTYLTEYLGISLYLLACAFVLRLILDLL